MCGITAVIGLEGWVPERQVIERMTAALVHRGPDDDGFHCDGQIAFGFRRLAILDLTPEGHQPMWSPDRKAVVIFNGEIYNYVELRQELAGLGHRFRSTGDTEVLLAAYRQWGADCVNRFNGMFAFLIQDHERGVIFGARDRFGVKPMYHYRSSQAVLLASEIKAIVASGLYQPRVNWSVAAKYLVQGRLDDSPETFYDGVTAVPPGHTFEIAADGQMRLTRYWFWPEPFKDEVPDAPERLAELLEDSVRLRLRSDVPVGVCLSGGLDSTSIICSMARQRQRDQVTSPLLAFSYNTPEFDESRYVRDTVAQTGATLVPLPDTEEQLWDNLRRSLQFQDEPVISMAPVASFGLMRLARQHNTTVVLNGQGADEILGGYSSYFRDWWFTLAARGQVLRALQEIQEYASAHGGDARRMRFELLRHVGFSLIGSVPGYRGISSMARAGLAKRNKWFLPALTSAIPGNGGRSTARRLNSVLRRSVAEHPLPLYLRLEDRNSMAHSIEVRLPFLDYRLVSFVMQLPADWKVRGPWNKHLLREAMRGRIPESVRSRVDKMGFATPSNKWFANRLLEPIRDLLGSQAARERGIYRGDSLVAELERNRGGTVDYAGPIFRAAQFELWLQHAPAMAGATR